MVCSCQPERIYGGSPHSHAGTICAHHGCVGGVHADVVIRLLVPSSQATLRRFGTGGGTGGQRSQQDSGGIDLTNKIDAEKYRERLLARERELVEETAHFDAEAREARTAEVQDPIDVVTSDENKAANFQMGDLAARTLQQ